MAPFSLFFLSVSLGNIAFFGREKDTWQEKNLVGIPIVFFATLTSGVNHTYSTGHLQ